MSAAAQAHEPAGQPVRKARRRGLIAVLLIVAVLVVLGVVATALNFRGEDPIAEPAAAFTASAAQVERGRYLATAGNCVSCHTRADGAPMAGGLGIETPFGTIFTSNLTPDAATGLGRWSAAHFWRAMHNGRSRDGRLLYPAFPYPNYTEITREDSDALYAYLRTLAPVSRPNKEHQLRFPFNTQVALGVWRAMFFAPGSFQADPQQSAEWNRGAYLTRGLGHCIACHSSRNAFGATSEKLELSGGLIPVQNWYAPSLNALDEAGVGDWPTQDVVELLKTGVSRRGSVLGPMAEVVYRSTQHLSDTDLTAIAVFLKGLPHGARAPQEGAPAAGPQLARGGEVYTQQCAQCHGDAGQGAAGAYPALAGNRTVTMRSKVNLVRVVLNGGYLPATEGNPRPYGMPPFAQALSNADLAAVVSYVRGSWGNQADAISEIEVVQLR